MASARAVGVGVIAFPLVVVWTALTEPFALLLVEFSRGPSPGRSSILAVAPDSSTDCSSVDCVPCRPGRCSQGG